MRLGIGELTCNWGSDVALLYSDTQEMIDAVTAISIQGLMDGNNISYVLNEDVERYVRHAIQSVHTPEETSGEGDCIENRTIFIPRERLPEIFDMDNPYSYMDLVDNLYYGAQENGEKAYRSFVDVNHALRNGFLAHHPEKLDASQISVVLPPDVYSNIVLHFNTCIATKDWLQVLLYDTRCLSGVQLMTVLESHRFVLKGGQLIQNSLFGVK